MFVIGGSVKGGKVYGKWPGLEPEQLYEGRDLALTTDFRSVFSEVAAKHLGAKRLDVLFPGMTRLGGIGWACFDEVGVGVGGESNGLGRDCVPRP